MTLALVATAAAATLSAHHVGTPAGDGIAWESVAVRPDGTEEVRRSVQEGLSPLRPPVWEGDFVQRVDVPAFAVDPEGFERTLVYWLGPGVSERACHRAKAQPVRGGVPLCFVARDDAGIAGEVRIAGGSSVGATVGGAAVFAAALAGLGVLARWLARRAKEEARDAYIRRELGM
ncbi:MAG: hypothetical protein ACOZNI_05090 [Myxococcota bacterium]